MVQCYWDYFYLYFLLNMNYLPDAIDNAITFAVDTTIYISGINIWSIHRTVIS